MLADDQGRIILFEIDTDVSQSFCTMRDVVRDTYVGMEMDENKLMCVDKGPTTRNML
jgi:citrate lyase gamma subunit